MTTANSLRNRILFTRAILCRGAGRVRFGRVRAHSACAIQCREPGHDIRRDGAGGLACSRNRLGRGFCFRTDTGTISYLRGWAEAADYNFPAGRYSCDSGLSRGP